MDLFKVFVYFQILTQVACASNAKSVTGLYTFGNNTTGNWKNIILGKNSSTNYTER